MAAMKSMKREISLSAYFPLKQTSSGRTTKLVRLGIGYDFQSQRMIRLKVFPLGLGKKSRVALSFGQRCLFASNSRGFNDRPWWQTLEARQEAFKVRRTPLSTRDLVLDILRIRQNNPPRLFADISAEHDHYPQFWSNDSYNLLLYLACKEWNPSHFEGIYEAMRVNGFGDQLSVQLYLRHLVKHGRGGDVDTFLKSHANQLPQPQSFLDIISAPNQRQRPLSTPDHRELPVLRLGLVRAAISGLSHEPDMAYAGFKKTVEALICRQYHAWAVPLVRQFIRRLPANISVLQIDQARSLIHLLLVPPTQRPSSERLNPFSLCIVLDLFKEHPSLVPNSNTVVLFLNTLQRHRARGSIGFRFVKSMVDTWGLSIEDTATRRLVARYAIETGDLSLARKVIRQETASRTGASSQNSEAFEYKTSRWKARNNHLWIRVLSSYDETRRKLSGEKAGRKPIGNEYDFGDPLPQFQEARPQGVIDGRTLPPDVASELLAALTTPTSTSPSRLTSCKGSGSEIRASSNVGQTESYTRDPAPALAPERYVSSRALLMLISDYHCQLGNAALRVAMQHTADIPVARWGRSLRAITSLTVPCPSSRTWSISRQSSPSVVEREAFDVVAEQGGWNWSIARRGRSCGLRSRCTKSGRGCGG